MITTIAMILGVASIVIAAALGMFYGVIAATIALGLGIAAIVLGIVSKKATGRGLDAVICGVIGVVIAVIFEAGCISYGNKFADAGYKASYGCLGMCGGAIELQHDEPDTYLDNTGAQNGYQKMLDNVK